MAGRPLGSRNKPMRFTSPIRKIIGITVHEARINKGWSQKKLAQKAGVAQSFIARVEYGSGAPTIELLSYVLEALGYEFRVQTIVNPFSPNGLRSAADVAEAGDQRDVKAA